MSRTDKDTKERVRASWDLAASEIHAWGCKHNPLPRPNKDLDCTLDDLGEPDWKGCYLKRSDYRGLRSWGGPPASYCRSVWTTPDRARTRTALIQAKAEWNADGDTDVEPPIDQHRHGAWWTWW